MKEENRKWEHQHERRTVQPFSLIKRNFSMQNDRWLSWMYWIIIWFPDYISQSALLSNHNWKHSLCDSSNPYATDSTSMETPVKWAIKTIYIVLIEHPMLSFDNNNSLWLSHLISVAGVFKLRFFQSCLLMTIK